nr:1068_t:CDS:10 [Entrophospora candida]
MNQSPTIYVLIKRTDEVDWATPLKKYIQTTYQEDPEKYADEANAIHRLRQDMRGAGKDVTGRDLLYRYDAFTHKATSQHSLAYEKACTIFNIAANLSAIAASENWSEQEGFKRSYNFFQASAGMFTYINDNFLHAPSTDLNRDTVKLLSQLMLSQAQECMFEQSLCSKKKPTLIAKLAAQLGWSYGNIVENMADLISKSTFDKSWSTVCQIKHKYYSSIAQYQKALACEAENKYGECVGRLNIAENFAKDANKLGNNFVSSFSPTNTPTLPPEAATSLQDLTKSNLALVTEKKISATRDNDLVYHEVVPQESIISPIEKVNAAKTILISDLYGPNEIQKVIGPDIFQRLIPLSVHESASLYSEEQSKMIRGETERCDLADSELDTALEYMKLPGILAKFKETNDTSKSINELATPTPEVRQLANTIQEEEQQKGSLNELIITLNGLKTRSKELLNDINALLENEKKEYESLKSKYHNSWTQPTSSSLNSVFHQDLSNHCDTLEKATNSDRHLTQLYDHIKNDIKILSNGENDEELEKLFAETIASIVGSNNIAKMSEESKTGSENPNFEEQVSNKAQKIEEYLNNLQKIKKERMETLKDLKEKIHQDDISHILILNKKNQNIEPQLFATELEKFSPYKNRITASIHHQQALLQELTLHYKSLMQGNEAKTLQGQWDRIEHQRKTISEKLRKSKDNYFEVKEGLRKGIQFYVDLLDLINTLHKSVQQFSDSRQKERNDLIQSIQKQDQQRLKEQLEILSNATNSSKVGSYDSLEQRLVEETSKMSLNTTNVLKDNIYNSPPPLLQQQQQQQNSGYGLHQSIPQQISTQFQYQQPPQKTFSRPTSLYGSTSQPLQQTPQQQPSQKTFSRPTSLYGSTSQPLQTPQQQTQSQQLSQVPQLQQAPQQLQQQQLQQQQLQQQQLQLQQLQQQQLQQQKLQQLQQITKQANIISLPHYPTPSVILPQQHQTNILQPQGFNQPLQNSNIQQQQQNYYQTTSIPSPQVTNQYYQNTVHHMKYSFSNINQISFIESDDDTFGHAYMSCEEKYLLRQSDYRTPQTGSTNVIGTGIYPQQYLTSTYPNNASYLQTSNSNMNPMMSITGTRSVYPVPVASLASITGNGMPAAKRVALAPTTTTQPIQNIYPNLAQNQLQLAQNQLYGSSGNSTFSNQLINTVRTANTVPTQTYLGTDGSSIDGKTVGSLQPNYVSSMQNINKYYEQLQKQQLQQKLNPIANNYNLINNSHPAAQQINHTIQNPAQSFENQMDWLELTNDEDIVYDDLSYNTEFSSTSNIEGNISDWAHGSLLQKNINYSNQNLSSKSSCPLISPNSHQKNNSQQQESQQQQQKQQNDKDQSPLQSQQDQQKLDQDQELVSQPVQSTLQSQQQQQHNDNSNQQSATIVPTNLLNISNAPPPKLHLPTNQGIAGRRNRQVNKQSEKNPSVANNISPIPSVSSQFPNQPSSMPTTNPITTNTIKPPRLVYAPKTRRVDSYGGLDLTVFERLPLPLIVPIIQDLGAVDIHALTMSLKSGMKLEVTNALNTLTTISSHKSALVDLSRCGELVDVLIDIIMEYFNCVSINYYSDKARYEISLPNSKFLTYVELFQQSKREYEEFSDVELEQFSISEGWLPLHEQCWCALNIIRNFSFTHDNHKYLAHHPRIKSSKTDLHNKKRYARKKAYDILEYRKSVLIILSNIAGYVLIPSIPVASELLLIISDFLNNSDDYYAQIALEVLSKLTVSYENRQKFGECDEDTLKSIFEKLVRLLPKAESNIFGGGNISSSNSSYNNNYYNSNIITHTSSIQELPFLATLIMSFFNFASLSNETMKKRIITTPGFINRMLKMTLVLASVRNIRTGVNEVDCVMLARRSMEMLKVLAKGNKESFLVYNEQLLNALLTPYIDPVVVKDLEGIVIYHVDI